MFLAKEHVIFFDFNDLSTKLKFSDITLINTHIQSLLKQDMKNYLFFDEIQELNNFQTLINSLSLHENIDIYITGSNSKLLSSEISTLLTGKNIKIVVYPLTFKEILPYYQDKYNLSIEESFDRFLINGGMPGALAFYDDNNSCLQYLKMIFSDILQHDILNRHVINDFQEFMNIFYYLQENIGNELVVDNLRNYLTTNYKSKITNATISNYIT
jgi:predicted AAA+ superfamily ATPase